MTEVLLIDDDEKLGGILKNYFAQYDLNLSVATTPSQGYSLLESVRPDIVVLDIMLPEENGFDVCKKIRSMTDPICDVPIFMLSARGEVTDRIVGLELGADEYMPKPYDARELVARIHNILKRTRKQRRVQTEEEIDDGLVVDRVRHIVSLDGDVLDLTTMEYELLLMFVDEPSKVFDRDEIMNRLRGIDVSLYSRAVDTLVSRLRNKLQDTSRMPRFIRTVWGTGYAFIGKVS